MRTAMRGWAERVWVLPGLCSAGVCLWAYTVTLTPGLANHDFGEMQVLSRLPGIPHAAYALYVWLGFAVSHLLPFGSPAWRMNFFSALCGAGSVWMVALLVLELTPPSTFALLAAAFAATVFGLSYVQWTISIFAQSYELHVLLGLSVVWLTVRWLNCRDERWLCAACFLAATMMSNHLIGLSVVPGVGLVLLFQPPLKEVPRRLALALAWYALGLLFANVFLFWLLFLQNSPLDSWHTVILPNADRFPFLTHSRDFWHCLVFNFLAMQFSQSIGSKFDWVSLQLRLFPHRFVAELFPLGALGALLGIVWLAFRRRLVAVLLLGVVLAQTALSTQFQIWKWPYYFVLPYSLAAIALGFAVERIGTKARRALEVHQVWGRLNAGGSATVMLLGLLAVGFANWSLAKPYRTWLAKAAPDLEKAIGTSFGPRPNQSRDTYAVDEALPYLEQIPDGSMVIADWGMLYPLIYLARIEARKPNLLFQEGFPWAPGPAQFTPARQAILADVLKKRPIYLIGNAGAATGPWRFQQVAPNLVKFEPL